MDSVKKSFMREKDKNCRRYIVSIGLRKYGVMYVTERSELEREREREREREYERERERE